MKSRYGNAFGSSLKFIPDQISGDSILNSFRARRLRKREIDILSLDSMTVEEKFYRPKPSEFFEVGGLSYYSCSS